VIDIRALRADPDAVKGALARRGVEAAEVDAVLAADAAWSARVAAAEAMRAEVKEISRQVGQAKKAGHEAQAIELSARSRQLGEEERVAAAEAETLLEERQTGLLYLPNIPAEDAPDGMGEDDNVEVRRWWPGQDAGRPEPRRAEHHEVPHWEIGESLQILDMERGARLAGSMFPLYRGPGARLLRALTAFAIDRHAPAYEEIRPPTVVLTETMTSTGHLPKFADDAYHLERDDLWLIPTAEVPLTSMHRGEILEESQLPLRFTAATACYRREAGSAGRDTRGLLRVHEFDKVELFAYTTPDDALEAQADILRRAESMLQELELPYRVLDLCCGDLGGSSARTFDLAAYAPGVDRWLEVSSVSWFRDYQARRANVRFRPAGGGSLQLVHTVNGSALAWPRIWAALVENGRQPDGTVLLPECLAPYLGGELLIKAP
jgi:seryl-tRNA synthetase